MTLDEMKALPPDKQKEIFNRVKAARHKGKTTVYSATYGVGKVKLARSLGSTEKEADKLLKAYWKRNWAIKAFVDDLKVKTIKDQMWVLNPVSKLWYSLRSDRDKWSTVNQSTGAYVFDNWLREILSQRKQLTGQMHDECILEIKLGHREACTKLIKDAMARVNERLKLNVCISVETQYGKAYSDIH